MWQAVNEKDKSWFLHGLNQVARFDAYPMPTIEELIATIWPAVAISTFDLAKSYCKYQWLKSQ